jgi:hypothetical protein
LVWHIPAGDSFRELGQPAASLLSIKSEGQQVFGRAANNPNSSPARFVIPGATSKSIFQPTFNQEGKI